MFKLNCLYCESDIKIFMVLEISKSINISDSGINKMTNFSGLLIGTWDSLAVAYPLCIGLLLVMAVCTPKRQTHRLNEESCQGFSVLLSLSFHRQPAPDSEPGCDLERTAQLLVSGQDPSEGVTFSSAPVEDCVSKHFRCVFSLTFSNVLPVISYYLTI